MPRGKGRKGLTCAHGTVLRAGVPDRDGNVYTEGLLFDLACKNPGTMTYDPKTKSLIVKASVAVVHTKEGLSVEGK